MFKVVFNYGEVEVKLESMRPHLRKQSEIGTLSVSSTPPFTEEDTDLVSNWVPFRFLSIVPLMKRTSPLPGLGSCVSP